MSRARAYGLSIETDFCLPDWFIPDATSDLPDVVVQMGAPQRSSAIDSSQFRLDRSVLVFPDWLDAEVLDGRRIVVHPGPGCDERMLALLVAGPALAVALRQRGNLVLHGSAVGMGEGSVAIVGSSGSGKSTTAALLVESGFRLLADDVVAITSPGRDPRVEPGYPLLKLWPDAVRQIGRDPLDLPIVEAGDAATKRGLPALDFELGSRSVRAVIVIDSQAGEQRSLGGAEAVKAISDNLYVPPFRIAESEWESDFSSVAALVANLEVVVSPREAIDASSVRQLLGMSTEQA